MRIILVTNYTRDGQESMQRFAEVLGEGLKQQGIHIECVQPRVLTGRICGDRSPLCKWLGYVDKFLLFPGRLRFIARDARVRGSTVFHICDHSNAMYLKWLRGVSVLVTCHDMLAVRSALGEIPQNPTRRTGRVLQNWIIGSLRRLPNIVCVSEATRRDLARLTGRAPGEIRVIHNGLNFPFHRMEPGRRFALYHQLAERHGVNWPRTYLFHIGGNQWYKNRVGLVRIYAELVRLNPGSPTLVIAGKAHTENVRREIERLGLRGRILHVGRVSNEELNALYTGAEAFVFPSLAEGFGWPVIESQAAGCRVVTGNLPPLNEIGGPAALYADPEQPVAFAATLNQLLAEDETERENRIQKGLQHAGRFSSEAMVDGYLREYRRIVNGAGALSGSGKSL